MAGVSVMEHHSHNSSICTSSLTIDATDFSNIKVNVLTSTQWTPFSQWDYWNWVTVVYPWYTVWSIH